MFTNNADLSLLIGSPLWWLAWAFMFFMIIIGMVISIQKRLLAQPIQHNIWFGTNLFLTALWLIKAQMLGQFYIHLIGASMAVLLLGYAPALLCLTVTLIFSNLMRHEPWVIWGLQFVLVVFLPVTLASLIHRLANQVLPSRLFVYIIGKGFFVSALVMLITCTINLWMLQKLGVVNTGNTSESIIYVIPVLLAWGEALLSGMAYALIAVYKPHWWANEPTFTDI